MTPQEWRHKILHDDFFTIQVLTILNEWDEERETLAAELEEVKCQLERELAQHG